VKKHKKPSSVARSAFPSGNIDPRLLLLQFLLCITSHLITLAPFINLEKLDQRQQCLHRQAEVGGGQVDVKVLEYPWMHHTQLSGLEGIASLSRGHHNTNLEEQRERERSEGERERERERSERDQSERERERERERETSE
jgi:hypothetical protein